MANADDNYAIFVPLCLNKTVCIVGESTRCKKYIAEIHVCVSGICVKAKTIRFFHCTAIMMMLFHNNNPAMVDKKMKSKSEIKKYLPRLREANIEANSK